MQRMQMQAGLAPDELSLLAGLEVRETGLTCPVWKNASCGSWNTKFITAWAWMLWSSDGSKILVIPTFCSHNIRDTCWVTNVTIQTVPN